MRSIWQTRLPLHPQSTNEITYPEVAWQFQGTVKRPTSGQLCLTLATPWTVACQLPLSMGFSRQEYWSGLPFLSPGDFTDPEIEPGTPACRQILYQLSFEGSPLINIWDYPVYKKHFAWLQSPSAVAHTLSVECAPLWIWINPLLTYHFVSHWILSAAMRHQEPEFH